METTWKPDRKEITATCQMLSRLMSQMHKTLIAKYCSSNINWALIRFNATLVFCSTGRMKIDSLAIFKSV